MRTVSRLFILILLVTLIGCSTSSSSPADNDKVFEIKFGHTGAPDHHYQEIALQFAEAVKERTNGKVDISVFPADQLGNQLDSVEGVMIGTQDMVLTSDMVLSNWMPDMGILNLPFLFEDQQHVRRVLDGEIGEKLGAKVEEHGAKLIAWWDGGFRHVTNSLRPIEKPEDLKGIKIRVPEGEVYINTFLEFGASPTPISFGELYTALQMGTVDAQENPPAHILTQKFYEVQKYVSRTGHIYFSSPLIMNKELFDSMPKEYQEALLDEGRKLAQTHTDLIIELEKTQWDEVAAQGMEILDPDLEPFKETVQPVIEKFKESLDGEIIEAIMNAK